MPNAIPELDYPEEANSMARPRDVPEQYQQINVNPNMFGAFGGQAISRFGQGMVSAGNAGLEIATDAENRVNRSQALQLHSWANDQISDEYAKLNAMTGDQAVNYFPQFKQNLQSIAQQAMSQARSPNARQMLDQNLRSTTDFYYRSGARHTGEQQRVAENAHFSDAVTTFGQQAMTAERGSDPTEVDNIIERARNTAIEFNRSRGLPDEEIAKNTQHMVGSIILPLIEHHVVAGTDADIARAEELLTRYRKGMDLPQQIAAEKAIQSRKEIYEGQREAAGIVADQAQPKGTSEDSGLSSDQILERNKQYVKPGTTNYQTALSADDEVKFRTWVSANKVPFDPNDPKADYDMRGFWKALQAGDPKAKSAIDPNDGKIHYPDYWKTPYDLTFSKQSQFATPGAPDWNDKDQLVTPAGKVVYDDRNRTPVISPPIGQSLGANGVTAVDWGKARQAAIDRYGPNSPNPDSAKLARTLASLAQMQQANQISLIDAERAQRLQREQAQQRSDVAETAILQDVAGPNPKITATDVANNPLLTREAKERSLKLIEASGGQRDVKTYGPGFYDLFARLHAAPDDPNRITDPTEFYKHIGPGGDLTIAGLEKLTQVMKQDHASTDDQAVNTSKAGLLKYAQSAMGREQIIPGMGPVATNKKGMEIFNSTFVPRFEAAFDKWIKDGKDPWQFLTKKNVDEMMDQVYPPSQRNADSVAGLGQTPAGAPEDESAPLPPTPAGLNDSGWKSVVAAPPLLVNGQRASHQQWANALEILAKNPTPKTMAAFDKWFGASGYQAQEVLSKLKAAKATAAPASDVDLPLAVTMPVQ